MGRREDIEARMRALEAERAQLDRYGEDFYDDGDVIKFVKSFKFVRRTGLVSVEEYETRTGTHDFTYVALKANDKWFMTGRRDNEGRGMSWDHLVEFMYAGIPVDHITIVIAEDFRTREELERELAEAAKNFDPTRLNEALQQAMEIPQVQIRRGGVAFPSRGVWSGVDSELTAPSDEDVKALDDYVSETGGWCAPSVADVNLVDPENKNNEH